MRAFHQLAYRMTKASAMVIGLWWGYASIIHLCTIPSALLWSEQGCKSRKILIIVVVNNIEHFEFYFGDSADDFHIQWGSPRGL